MTTKTEQMERGALLSDANQTAVFLDRNGEDHPDMDIFWQAANIMRALIESYELIQIENETMRKNLGALHVYATAGKNPGRDLNEFAAEFPRTWNAIITDNPTSFDLPDKSA